MEKRRGGAGKGALPAGGRGSLSQAIDSGGFGDLGHVALMSRVQGPVDATGLISDLLVTQRAGHRLLAPAVTSEIRDDIFSLNKLRLSALLENSSCVSREDFCRFLSCFLPDPRALRLLQMSCVSSAFICVRSCRRTSSSVSVRPSLGFLPTRVQTCLPLVPRHVWWAYDGLPWGPHRGPTDRGWPAPT